MEVHGNNPSEGGPGLWFDPPESNETRGPSRTDDPTDLIVGRDVDPLTAIELMAERDGLGAREVSERIEQVASGFR